MGYGSTIVPTIHEIFLCCAMAISCPCTMTSTDTPENTLTISTRGSCFAVYILSLPI